MRPRISPSMGDVVTLPNVELRHLCRTPPHAGLPSTYCGLASFHMETSMLRATCIACVVRQGTSWG